MFDLKTKKCSSCPNGVDPKTHVCKAIIAKKFKPVSSIKGKVVLQPNQNSTDLNDYMNSPGDLCPEDKPFSTGDDCIACYAPTDLFNLSTKKCTSCPNGYNTTIHQCNPASETFKPVASIKDKVVLQPNQNVTDLNNYMNSPGDLCPTDKPFSIGSSCIQCSDPKPFFDLQSKSCISCDLNITTHKCKAPTVSVPFADSKPRVVLSGNLTNKDLDNYYAT